MTDKICPLCGGKIPKEKIEEFESKFKAQESKIKEQLEQEFGEKLESEKERSEEKITQQKELFEEFKETLKKQAEEERDRSKQEIEKAFAEKTKIKDDELASIKKKLKEAEKEEEEIEEKIEEKYKKKFAEFEEKIEDNEEKEEKSKSKIDELKDSLKEKTEKFNEVKNDYVKQTEKLKDDYEEKLRKLENKTPTELGEEGQAETLDILTRTFSHDDITETKHGKSGSDIFHKIIYNGEEVGLIVYEVKNVSTWNNDFIEQAKEEKTKHHANYALLVTNTFPAKEKIISEKGGIIIVCPTKVAIIAREIRNFLVEAHKAKLTGEEIEEKIKVLQEYLTSSEYKNMCSDLANAIKDWYNLIYKEKTSHERHWTEEEKLNNKIHEKTVKIHAKITSIIENRNEKIPIIIKYKKTKKKKKSKK